MNSKRFLIVASACITAMMLWPADAAAQRRGYRRSPVRTTVFVGAGFYRPIYYDPFFYSGFYDPFYLGWYPVYGQYPRPYGYYGYGGGYWASARIEVKPREGQVYLDGYFVGMVDQFDGVFQRLDLPAGEHDVTVYLKGYRPFRQKTLFRPGESYHFKAILEPLAAGTADEPVPQPSANAPDPYTQSQRRDPRDPYGRDPYGRQPSGDPNQPSSSDPGRTMPLPERPGDRRPNDRQPDSGTFGTLNIRVQPADAVVTIDGEKWDSPEGGSRLVVQLAGGSHRVEIRKDGFKPYSGTVQIRPGEAQTLNISLPPGLQP